MKETFAKNFVSTRVNIESGNGLKFAQRFKLPHPLISLFVDTDGNVLHIYKLGPTLDSRIYKVIQAVTPRKMMDSIYKTIPYPEAVALNNGIIGNTFSKAVRTKDQNLIFQLSSFIHGTYGA